MLLFTRQRRQNFNGGLSLTGPSASRAEDQAGMRVPGDGFQYFVRLFYCEPGIPLQKSCSVAKCNIERSYRLRNAVQLNIQLIPAIMMGL